MFLHFSPIRLPRLRMMRNTPMYHAAAPVVWFLAASADQCAVEPATDVQTCLIFATLAFEHLCSNFFPLFSSFFASTHSTRSLGDCHNLLSVIPSSAISRACKYIPSASSFWLLLLGSRSMPWLSTSIYLSCKLQYFICSIVRCWHLHNTLAPNFQKDTMNLNLQKYGMCLSAMLTLIFSLYMHDAAQSVAFARE
jgi:hypothetical protein